MATENKRTGKWMTAAAAVKQIQRGQRVFVGSGAAEPQVLVQAMTERKYELVDTEIVHLLTLGSAPYTDKDFSNVFRHNALFVGANVRDAVAEGRADYTPIFLSEIPRLFRRHRLHLDAALIQVTPPDSHGYCSFGVSVDIVKAAAASASLVIAQVNSCMPRTLGDSFIHVDNIDILVEQSKELPESLPAAADDISEKIGHYVASLIDDGATLQIGIGSVPNAVVHALIGKKDLGVHSEMLSDWVVDLMEAGAITGRRKQFLEGKIVTSFCMGTKRLYDYIDDNPVFEFRPVEFTNDPFTISRNYKMTTINTALEVDLTGQVCSDSIGFRFYSGIGGQVDFIRGAARSPEGKPIIALASTAGEGKYSRIVPHLRQGAGVVTTRGDVHYVVTEYGVADLWGKNVRERALALISIAHPDFRDGLLEKAKQHKLVFEDQIVSRAEYPVDIATTEFSNGELEVDFRPIRPVDEQMLKEMFYSLSERSVSQRFFQRLYTMPHERLQKIANVDYHHNMCIVGLVQKGDGEQIIAVGDYHLDPATGMADVAFLVQDQYQGAGLGTFLLKHLMYIARKRGILGFMADVLPENRSMLHIFNKSGCEIKTTFVDGFYHIEFRFDSVAEGGANRPPQSSSETGPTTNKGDKNAQVK